MSIVYEKWITITGTIKDYSTASSITGFSIKRSETNFGFRFIVRPETYDSPEPSTFEFTKAKLKGKLPDGTEFQIDNLSAEIRTDGPYKYYNGSGRSAITIPFDERFTSQVGTGAYVLIMGTESNPNVASWQFKIQVVNDENESINQISVDLDMDPHKPPLHMHLNQYDTNYKLIIHLYCSNGVWTPDDYSSNITYLMRAYIRGIRSDGEIIDDLVAYSYTGSRYSINSYQIVIDGTTDAIAEKLTAVSGVFTIAFTLRGISPKPERDMNTSQRVVFHIEPLNREESR